MSNKTPGGPLAAAAAAFEEELARYAELAHELRANPMNTQKALGRAKGSLQESAASEERLGQRIAALAQAMNAAREKQLAVGAETLELARKVQARTEDHLALMDRFAALGEQVRAVQEPLGLALAGTPEETETARVATRMHDLTTNMDAVIEEAAAIGETAESGDWIDLARDATSLKQQVQAARNKAVLVLRKLTPQPPS